MGGIKNKLSKLSNKVKTLLSSLSLTERADERSSSGEVINNTNSKSSGFCHLIRQTPSATFPVKGKELTPPFRKRRQMKSGRISIGGFDRLVRITKYTSLACLTLAILSTLVLNIISSYSNSNIESNAEPVTEVSTLANNDSSTCDPNNTNAASCISMSISSHSATGDTDDGNLSLSIPQGGGLVAGRHTVGINAGSEIASYSVFLNGGTNENGVDNTDLVNTMADSLPNTGSLTTSIPSLTWNGDFSVINSFPMQGNAWGVALPDNYPGLYNDKSTYESLITSPDSSSNGPMYTFTGIPPISDGQHVPNQPLMGNEIIRQEDNSLASTDIYYGVKVDDSSTMLAGDYTTNVVYTVIAELKEPTITNIAPNTYELDSNTSIDINNQLPVTIAGTNLQSTYQVYLQSDTGSGIQYDLTNNITNATSTSLTVTLPTDFTDPSLEPGNYTIHVIAQGGEASVSFTYTESSICRNADPDSECQVDTDANMIPVTYIGYDGNGGGHWVAVSDNDIQNTRGSWYDYGKKQWANAVTVSNPSKYTNVATGTPVDNNDVLGYWVYIPRYAYEVMRPNAVDRVVDDTIAEEEGGFKIKFETVNDTKKIPKVSCNLGISTAAQMWADGTPTSNAGPTNTNILAKDYRMGCWPNNRAYHRQTIAEAGSPTNNTTTWATHPAFSWGSEEIGYIELNGLWIGKFMMTGKISAPTVKPNQHANIDEFIGDFYLSAKSVGANDEDNVGGGSSSDAGRPTLVNELTQNSHRLDVATSHMVKNSERGVVTYLSFSRYGAGVNNIYINGSHTSRTDADGDATNFSTTTGCGPARASMIGTGRYNDGTVLSEDLIESPTACSQDVSRAYNGSLGVLASSTNTIYGVYDMRAQSEEFVAGNFTHYDNQSETIGGSSSSGSSYMRVQAKPPYVDLYRSIDKFGTKPGWSSGSNVGDYNFDVCTWSTCGGHALHETMQRQSDNIMWGDAYVDFVQTSYNWFKRGGVETLSSSRSMGGGGGDENVGSRIVLLVKP